MSNPHPYYVQRAIVRHQEPDAEWIERTLTNPYTAKEDSNHPHRTVYYSYIPEFGRGHWLLVIVQNDQLFNAYFDRTLLRASKLGRPEE